MSVSFSPGYLATRTTAQKLLLLSDEAFLDACGEDDQDPYALLGISPDAPAVERCLHPVVLDRMNIATGEITNLVLPCGSPNAVKCPSCGEFQARLRQRQILNGLQIEGVQCALFTTTAPSFGAVHRPSWSAKDEYKNSKKPADQKRSHKMSVMKQKGPCPCGGIHEYKDDVVGTPLDVSTYDYAGEVIWSENLPALTKSLSKTLKRLALGFGIPKENFATFSVYERQKRGSLHLHTLITVQGLPKAFDLLVDEISRNWHIHAPTAQIPAHRLAMYRSQTVQDRWGQVFGSEDASLALSIEKSIPLVKWKRGELRPGTEFGTVYDIRTLQPTADVEDPNLSGYEQAGGYLAKYLTKNQSALSLDALALVKDHSPKLAKHYMTIRKATLALSGDRIVHEAQLNWHSVRQAEHVKRLAEIDLLPIKTPDDQVERLILRDLLKDLPAEKQKVQDRLDACLPADVIDDVFPKSFPLTVPNHVLLKHPDEEVRVVSRSLSIRLNKALNNGGFSGALTSVSNWVTSLTDLREEMKQFATGGKQDLEEYEWSINVEQTRAKALDRAHPGSWDTKQLRFDCERAEDRLYGIHLKQRAEALNAEAIARQNAVDQRIQEAFPGAKVLLPWRPSADEGTAYTPF